MQTITEQSIVSEYNRAYNVMLKIKTCEALGIYDCHSEYVPPVCMSTVSISNCLTIFKYRKWIDEMNRLIE